jgi:Na+/proline symporter
VQLQDCYKALVFFGVAAIFNPEIYPKYAKDIGILVGQLGTHLFFNMVWGIVFGILFVMFYDKIQREGILKGLIFGMVIYFLSTFRGAILLLSYASPEWFLTYGMGGLIGFLIFGIVLGLLYCKPSD